MHRLLLCVESNDYARPQGRGFNAEVVEGLVRTMTRDGLHYEAILGEFGAMRSADRGEQRCAAQDGLELAGHQRLPRTHSRHRAGRTEYRGSARARLAA